MPQSSSADRFHIKLLFHCVTHRLLRFYLINNRTLFRAGRHRNRERSQNSHVYGGQIDALLSGSLKPALAKSISVNGNKFWLNTPIQKPGAKNMVLVNAFINSPFPYPATSEFVPIPAFIEKNITTIKP